MGKQPKSKTTHSLGKGKVTPMQIAFIVDRYLSDNNFTLTRSAFRSEAASLISKSPVQEAPKNLLSLGAMLNEYISLKEQKVIVDQERVRLEQEKIRVQNLLQGMQNVMNVYNAGGDGNSFTPMIQNSATRSAAVLPQPSLSAGSPSPMLPSPNIMPASMTNVSKEQGSLSSSVTTYPFTRKRAVSNVVAPVPPTKKKSRGSLPLRKTPNSAAAQIYQPQIAQHRVLNRSAAQGSGSNVAKSLFNQSPNKSTSPTTPSKPVPSPNDQNTTPVGISANAHCSNSKTPQETPANCTIITSERVIVSPCKHVSYTMERTQCVSSSPVKATFKMFNKRENVKGRLDFDGSDVTNSFDTTIANEIPSSESDKEADIFDIDLDDFEAFGASFSDLLVDLDLGFEGLECPCQPALEMPVENSSGSLLESRDGGLGIEHGKPELSSTSKIANNEGTNTVTAVKSMTKRITLSPPKTNRSSWTQENSLQKCEDLSDS